MSDQQMPPGQTGPYEQVGDYPAPDFPTVFADGVMSTAWGRGLVKMYLYRTDPQFQARPGSRDNPIEQIIMPVFGFAQMCALFGRTLKALVEQGHLSQEQLDAIYAADATTKVDTSEPDSVQR